MDLSAHQHPEYKEFSGTITYRNRFTLSEEAATQPLTLHLGQVGVIATVSLNGKELGTVWTAPWKIDLSGMTKAGENALQIRVANTWNNRLVADDGRPREKRLTYVSQPYRKEKLQPSGLIGPVLLKTHE